MVHERQVQPLMRRRLSAFEKGLTELLRSLEEDIGSVEEQSKVWYCFFHSDIEHSE